MHMLLPFLILLTLYRPGSSDTVDRLKSAGVLPHILQISLMPTRSPAKRKNPAAVALSKLGASKGGEARAAKLSAKRRVEIARKAIAARWAKAK
jgi:hypothetical protein